MSVIESLNGWSESWLQALARGSLQGGIALAAVAIVCRLLPRIPAAWQCWLWRLAYLKFLLAVFLPGRIDLAILPARPAILPAPPAFVPARVVEEAPREVLTALLSHPVEAPTAPPRSTLPRLTFPTAAFLLWMAGTAVAIVQLLKKARAASSLRRESSELQNDWLQRRCAILARSLRLRRVPLVRLGESISSPLLVGVIHPVILLPGSSWGPAAEQGASNDPATAARAGDATPPVGAGETAAGADLVLAHELAHLKRHDLAWGWLPAAVKVLFFFHPVVWLVERESRLAQELACDDLALRVTSRPPLEYAALLVQLAGQAREGQPARYPFFIAPMIETKKSLLRRLTAMKQRTPFSKNRAAAAALFVTVIAAAGLVPWRLTAQNPPAAAEPFRPAAAAAGAEAAEAEKLKAELQAARARIDRLEREITTLRSRGDQSTPARSRPEAAVDVDPAGLADVLRAEMDAAKLDFEIAEQTLQHTQSLRRDNLVAPGDVDNARKALAQSRVRLEIARAQLRKAAGQAGASAPREQGRVVTEEKRKRQAELLEEEIKLAEQVTEETQKRLENGHATTDALIQAQREVFQLKREQAALESRTADMKALIEEEMKAVERQLREMNKRIEVGVQPKSSEIIWKRELLRLKRERAALE